MSHFIVFRNTPYMIHCNVFVEGSPLQQLKRVTTYPVWYYVKKDQTTDNPNHLSIFKNMSSVLYFVPKPKPGTKNFRARCRKMWSMRAVRIRYAQQ